MFRYLIAAVAIMQMLFGLTILASSNADTLMWQSLAGTGLVSLSLIPLAILATGGKRK